MKPPRQRTVKKLAARASRRGVEAHLKTDGAAAVTQHQCSHEDRALSFTIRQNADGSPPSSSRSVKVIHQDSQRLALRARICIAFRTARSLTRATAQLIYRRTWTVLNRGWPHVLSGQFLKSGLRRVPALNRRPLERLSWQHETCGRLLSWRRISLGPICLVGVPLTWGLVSQGIGQSAAIFGAPGWQQTADSLKTTPVAGAIPVKVPVSKVDPSNEPLTSLPVVIQLSDAPWANALRSETPSQTPVDSTATLIKREFAGESSSTEWPSLPAPVKLRPDDFDDPRSPLPASMMQSELAGGKSANSAMTLGDSRSAAVKSNTTMLVIKPYAGVSRDQRNQFQSSLVNLGANINGAPRLSSFMAAEPVLPMHSDVVQRAQSQRSRIDVHVSREQPRPKKSVPVDPQVYAQAAREFIDACEMNDLTQASRALEHLRTLFASNSVSLLRWEAVYFAKDGELSRARSALQAVLAQLPQDGSALASLKVIDAQMLGDRTARAHTSAYSSAGLDNRTMTSPLTASYLSSQ